VIVADLTNIDVGVIPDIRPVAAYDRSIDVSVTPVRAIVNARQRTLIVSKPRAVTRSISNAR
jgi:hypothetical protein